MARNYSNWIEQYIKFTDNSEPTINYRRWTAISVIASALRRKVQLKWGTDTFYPNMFIILVGPSAVRKGTAMRPAKKFLKDLGVSLASDSLTRERLGIELENSNDNFSTPDGYIFHCSLTLFAPELTVLIGGYNNQQLLMDLTDWYDCADEWRYQTKHQEGVDIINVWVNLLGATTPSLIQSALPGDAIGGGFTSRVIFVYADRKGKSIPDPFLPDDNDEQYQMLLEDLSSISSMYGEFQVTDEFMKHKYKDWYLENDITPKFTDRHLEGYNGRRPVHLLKLCMIVAAARGNDLWITEDIFDEALMYLEDAEQLMPLTFIGSGMNTYAGVLHDMMKFVAIEKKVRRSTIMAKYYQDFDRNILDRLILTMQTIGVCDLIIDYKGDGDAYLIYKEGSEVDPRLISKALSGQLRGKKQ